jgi:hypothetical protein
MSSLLLLWLPFSLFFQTKCVSKCQHAGFATFLRKSAQSDEYFTTENCTACRAPENIKILGKLFFFYPRKAEQSLNGSCRKGGNELA